MKSHRNILSILFILLAVGCTTNPNFNSNEKTAPVADTTDYGSAHDPIYYMFPSPEELMQIISDSDLSFSPNLLNSEVNSEKYSSQTAVNLNIGIYLADMAYCGLFQKHRETKVYIDLLSRMSNRIYLSPDLKLKLSQIREKGLVSGDSTEYLSGNFFYEIVNDLESSHQQKTVAVICAGAYIESLYLSLKSFEKYDYNSPLFKKLAEQQFAYKNMLAYLRQFENEKEINELVALLSPIEELYSKMHFTDNKLKVEEGSDSTLIISGGKVYKMDELTYIELKNKTEKIRQNFLKRQ